MHFGFNKVRHWFHQQIKTTRKKPAQRRLSPVEALEVRTVPAALIIGPSTIAEDANEALVVRFTRDSTSDPADVGFFLSAPQPFPFVDFTVSGAANFNGSAGLVYFADDELQHDILITPIDDILFEGDEVLTITNAPAEPAFSLTATIADDDDDGIAMSIVGASTISETSDTLPQSTTIQFTRSGDTSTPVEIRLDVSGSAIYRTDYEIMMEGSGWSQSVAVIMLPAGATAGNLNIRAVADGLYDADDTLIISHPALGSVQIEIKDPVFDVRIEAPFAPAIESDAMIDFIFKRTGNTGQELVVNYSLSGAATPGADFEMPASLTVIFPKNSDTVVLSLRPLTDLEVEPDEDIVITIEPGDHYTPASPSSAIGVIAGYFAISGEVFNDYDGDGDGDDGVYTYTPTIYLDLNDDGILQDNEPRRDDVPSTFRFTSLQPGRYVVRKVVYPTDVVTRVADVTIVNADIRGADVGVRLRPINNLMPVSQDLYRDTPPSVNERVVAALYRAILDRPADPTGMATWVAQLDSGKTVKDIAMGFQRSEEYAVKFVRQLYVQVLERDADPSGLADWSKKLMDGQSTSVVILGMMLSPEYNARFAANNAFVDKTLGVLLARDDPTRTWHLELDKGATREAVVLGILNSPEAIDRLIRSAYTSYFHRTPDFRDMAGWNRLLSAGMSSSEFLATFLASSEFRDRAAAANG